jgi:TonB family protein
VLLRISALVFAPLALAGAACASNPQPKSKIASARRTVVDSIDCLDTLRASDTIAVVVKMIVAPQNPKAILPRDFESLFVQEFRSHFGVPRKLPLRVVRGTPPCDSLGSRCVGGILSLGAVAYATAHDDGKLTDIEVVDAALTPSLADSLTTALQSMSRALLAPPVGDIDSIPLVLQLVPEESPDTVPAVRQVFSAKVPRYSSPFSYASMPMSGVNAKYPFNARLAGVEDSVTLAFTVESDGTIAARSIELVSAKYLDFVASVLEALGRTRFHAAHLGDCAVATRMEQRFFFRVPQ